MIRSALSSVIGGLVLWIILPPVLVSAQSATFPIQMQYGNDLTAPSTPQNVTATPISDTQIDVSWDAATDNVGVAGYQVLRDLVTVATTSQTSFSDTGLVASTTYAYTVRAFDGAGNVSSSSVSVATTTLETPPSPSTSTTTSSSQQSSSLPSIQIEAFTVDVGSEVARLRFQTNIPTQYTLSYQSKADGSGVAQTAALQREHRTVLAELRPDTSYEYTLRIRDRFGRVRVEAGSFTTEVSRSAVAPANVISFTAFTAGSDVLLQWEPPETESHAYVRVVRNNRFFPSDPSAGVVVYEGTASAFTDVGAVQTHKTQYYTAFAYDFSGMPASGVIAVASRRLSVTDELLPSTQPTDPITTASSTATSGSPVASIDRSAFRVVQGDTATDFTTTDIKIAANQPFRFALSAEAVPAGVRLVTVTLWRPEVTAPPLAFVLRRSEDEARYGAVLPGLRESGVYDVQLDFYDGTHERVASLTGLLGVSEQGVAAPSADPAKGTVQVVPLLYMIGGGIAGLMITVGLYNLLLRLWRSWSKQMWHHKSR